MLIICSCTLFPPGPARRLPPVVCLAQGPSPKGEPPSRDSLICHGGLGGSLKLTSEPHHDKQGSLSTPCSPAGSVPLLTAFARDRGYYKKVVCSGVRGSLCGMGLRCCCRMDCVGGGTVPCGKAVVGRGDCGLYNSKVAAKQDLSW